MPLDKDGHRSEPHVDEILRQRGSFSAARDFEMKISPTRCQMTSRGPVALSAEESSFGQNRLSVVPLPPRPPMPPLAAEIERPPMRERLEQLATPNRWSSVPPRPRGSASSATGATPSPHRGSPAPRGAGSAPSANSTGSPGQQSPAAAAAALSPQAATWRTAQLSPHERALARYHASIAAGSGKRAGSASPQVTDNGVPVACSPPGYGGAKNGQAKPSAPPTPPPPFRVAAWPVGPSTQRLGHSDAMVKPLPPPKPFVTCTSRGLVTPVRHLSANQLRAVLQARGVPLPEEVPDEPLASYRALAHAYQLITIPNEELRAFEDEGDARHDAHGAPSSPSSPELPTWASCRASTELHSSPDPAPSPMAPLTFGVGEGSVEAAEVVRVLTEMGFGLHRMAGAQQRELLLAVSRCLSSVLRAADTTLPQYSLFLSAASAEHEQGDGADGTPTPLPPPVPRSPNMPESSAVALRLTKAVDGLLRRAIEGDSVADEAALHWLAQQLERWPRPPDAPSLLPRLSLSPRMASQPAGWRSPTSSPASPAATGVAIALHETGPGSEGTLLPPSELTARRFMRDGLGGVNGLGGVTEAVDEEGEAIARALVLHRAHGANGARGRAGGGLLELVVSGEGLTYLLPLMVMVSSALTAYILLSSEGAGADPASGRLLPGSQRQDWMSAAFLI